MSWRRVLPEMLPVAQLLIQIPAFYRTRQFITIFTTVRYAGRVGPDLHTGRSPTQSDIYQMLY
jgi:hypothetical protein